MTDEELLKKVDELAEIGVKKSGKKPSKKDCLMTFDGKKLDLYADGELEDSLKAMSGSPYHQVREYQQLKNIGPIPEVRYWAPQEKRQFIDPLSAIGATDLWPGGIESWGLRRAWIDPDENTNTYGRDGFSIHGGESFGSAGCIDIAGQTDKLSDYLDDCQDVVPLDVKYKKEKW